MPSPERPSAAAFTDESVALGAWLDRLAARSPTPSGGSAAAVTLAAAAALASMVAAFSSELAEAGALRDLARSVSRRAIALAGSDERAVLAMLSTTSGTSPSGGEQDAALGTALEAALEAAAGPLRILELAAELCPVFRPLVGEGNPRLRGDALTGAALARAAASAAALLARLDAEALPPPERDRCHAAVARAEAEVKMSLAPLDQTPGPG